jgi:serine/threonine-protein kinase
MTWLPDSALSRLREVVDWPDFDGTKYEILEKLGQGGMASVYLARDRDLDRQLAIKVLHAAVSDPAVQERLEHPGILPVHDLGFLSDGRIYYAMKLVRGRRLDEYVAQGIPLPERLRIFVRICNAVAFAHSQGVIHRDLKPSNIMVGPFEEVLVIDWGLARVLPSEGLKDSKREQEFLLGTPGYMAPEQEQWAGDSTDERADVYALGVILDSLLPPAAPKALRAITKRSTSQKPADRYSAVSEMAVDIDRFLDGERVTAYRESVWETGRRLVVRHRTFVILVLTYLVIRIVLLTTAT